jgi:outer membrane protein TolC
MNKLSLAMAGVLLGFLPVMAQRTFSIEEVIERALAQSPFAKQAETRKENRYWQYRSFKTNYNPQLRLNGGLPNYSQSFIPVRQPDGSIVFQSVNQTNSTANLGLEQPLHWTGGTISANTNFNYFNDRERDFQSWNGTLLNVQLNQPLFGFNQLRWDRQTEPLRYEESKREFVEQMESISQEAADRFFGVLEAQTRQQISSFNLSNNDTIYKIEQGRYNIGTTSQDKLLQVELQLLRSRQDLAQAKLDLENASLALRIYLGLSDSDQIALELPENIPQFSIDLEEALQYAKQNRAAYLAFERRRLEAQRDVAQAKASRFQTSLIASYGLNNTAPNTSELYNDPQRQQQANITFSLPVIDWGRNKAMMRTAIANKKLNDYIITQEEVNFEQEIITQVRQFELLRLQLEITRKSDQVAQERYKVAQNRYLIGKIDITNLNIALTEKDDAKRGYIQALRSFWTAYYNLRRLTLYDFANRKLLYKSEL